MRVAINPVLMTITPVIEAMRRLLGHIEIEESHAEGRNIGAHLRFSTPDQPWQEFTSIVADELVPAMTQAVSVIVFDHGRRTVFICSRCNRRFDIVDTTVSGGVGYVRDSQRNIVCRVCALQTEDVT